MDPAIPLLSFVILVFSYVAVKANIEYRKRIKSGEINKNEETDEEWLDRQW